jgi:hypothetical protein
LKEAARQCASVDTLLASFEQKMSTKSSKIACSGKNSILKGDRPLIVCTYILELGIEPTLIRSALKRGIRLYLLLLDLSDF